MNTSEQQRQEKLLREAAQAALEQFRFPPQQLPWQWAEAERWLPAKVTAKPGPYRVSVTPFAQAWQESFVDPDVQVTVLMCAKRLAKTESCWNLIGQQMCQNPRNMMVVYPVVDGAKKASKQSFVPMVSSSPNLRWRIKDNKQKGSGNTILAKEFPGGTISFLGTLSPSAFRQVQSPIVWCDEIDAMNNTVEGDPVTLAFGRTENYPDGIQIVSSTPSLKGKPGGIESWYNRSDKQCWYVSCKNPGCAAHDHGWILQWANVHWTEGKTEEAVLVCPFCGERHNDEDRLAMVRAGVWKATAPFKGIRGFWLNGLNSPFPPKKGFKNKLHQFVDEFLDAKHKGSQALQAWTNTFLAESFNATTDGHDSGEFVSRLEVYPTSFLPEGVCCLTCGVDTQKDRLEAEIIGFGRGWESWGICRRMFKGDTSLRGVWDQLSEWLNQEFQHPYGPKMRVVRCHIDSGGTGDVTKTVYRFCNTCGRPWYAVKGSPRVLRDPVEIMKKRSRALNIDTVYFKNQIHEWLKEDKPGPRFCHFPDTYDKEFFDQLCAEKRETHFTKGRPVYDWQNVRPGGRNEALDCRVYAFSAAFVVNPNFESLGAWLERERVKLEERAKSDPAGTPVKAQSVTGKPAVTKPATPQRVRTRTNLGGLSGFGGFGRKPF